MAQDPKQKPAHTAPPKPSFSPPPAGKPAQPHQPQHPGSAPKHTDPKKK